MMILAAKYKATYDRASAKFGKFVAQRGRKLTLNVKAFMKQKL